MCGPKLVQLPSMASRWAQCEFIVMIMLCHSLYTMILHEAVQPMLHVINQTGIISNDYAYACSTVSPQGLRCSCQCIVVVQIEGAENLPAPDQPAVYVSNHQSFLVQSARVSFVVLCRSCACAILLPAQPISLCPRPIYAASM